MFRGVIWIKNVNGKSNYFWKNGKWIWLYLIFIDKDYSYIGNVCFYDLF